ncbi:MAG: glycosyltransferase family 88 protein [Legionella sp.]|jgi:hypothetical protein
MLKLVYTSALFNPKGSIMYLYDLTRFYKIWFSQNPEVFLGVENELRFIRIRQNNPKAILHLVYSSKCLTEKAISELKSFCAKYSIIALAFEDFESKLTDKHDKTVFLQAIAELEHFRNNTGGNVAAASDNARTLLPIIEECGIYSDFDVDFNFSKHEPLKETNGAILIPLEIRLNPQTKIISLIPNSDFLAFSIKSQTDNKHLSADAITALRSIQKKLIDNYATPLTPQKLGLKLKFRSTAVTIYQEDLYPEIPFIIQAFFKKHTNNPSIFDFRTFIASLPDEPIIEQRGRTVKNYLFGNSVISISGPSTIMNAFLPIFPKGTTTVPVEIDSNNEELKQYLPTLMYCCKSAYSSIKACIYGNNSAEGIIKMSKVSKSVLVSDESWTDEGKTEKLAREAKIKKSAVIIARSWKTFWNSPDMIYRHCQSLCNQNALLNPIKEKNYGLAFRRACAGLELPFVTSLLKFKKLKGIDLDINALSNNKKSALDWANDAKASGSTAAAVKTKLIKLLEENGALTGEQTVQMTHNKF